MRNPIEEPEDRVDFPPEIAFTFSAPEFPIPSDQRDINRDEVIQALPNEIFSIAQTFNLESTPLLAIDRPKVSTQIDHKNADAMNEEPPSALSQVGHLPVLVSLDFTIPKHNREAKCDAEWHYPDVFTPKLAEAEWQSRALLFDDSLFRIGTENFVAEPPQIETTEIDIQDLLQSFNIDFANCSESFGILAEDADIETDNFLPIYPAQNAVFDDIFGFVDAPESFEWPTEALADIGELFESDRTAPLPIVELIKERVETILCSEVKSNVADRSKHSLMVSAEVAIPTATSKDFEIEPVTAEVVDSEDYPTVQASVREHIYEALDKPDVLFPILTTELNDLEKSPESCFILQQVDNNIPWREVRDKEPKSECLPVANELITVKADEIDEPFFGYATELSPGEHDTPEAETMVDWTDAICDAREAQLFFKSPDKFVKPPLPEDRATKSNPIPNLSKAPLKSTSTVVAFPDYRFVPLDEISELDKLSSRKITVAKIRPQNKPKMNVIDPTNISTNELSCLGFEDFWTEDTTKDLDPTPSEYCSVYPDPNLIEEQILPDIPIDNVESTPFNLEDEIIIDVADNVNEAPPGFELGEPHSSVEPQELFVDTEIFDLNDNQDFAEFEEFLDPLNDPVESDVVTTENLILEEDLDIWDQPKKFVAERPIDTTTKSYRNYLEPTAKFRDTVSLGRTDDVVIDMTENAQILVDPSVDVDLPQYDTLDDPKPLQASPGYEYKLSVGKVVDESWIGPILEEQFYPIVPNRLKDFALREIGDKCPYEAQMKQIAIESVAFVLETEDHETEDFDVDQDQIEMSIFENNFAKPSEQNVTEDIATALPLEIDTLPSLKSDPMRLEKPREVSLRETVPRQFATDQARPLDRPIVSVGSEKMLEFEKCTEFYDEILPMFLSTEPLESAGIDPFADELDHQDMPSLCSAELRQIDQMTEKALTIDPKTIGFPETISQIIPHEAEDFEEASSKTEVHEALPLSRDEIWDETSDMESEPDLENSELIISGAENQNQLHEVSETVPNALGLEREPLDWTRASPLPSEKVSDLPKSTKFNFGLNPSPDPKEVSKLGVAEAKSLPQMTSINFDKGQNVEKAHIEPYTEVPLRDADQNVDWRDAIGKIEQFDLEKVEEFLVPEEDPFFPEITNSEQLFAEAPFSFPEEEKPRLANSSEGVIVFEHAPSLSDDEDEFCDEHLWNENVLWQVEDENMAETEALPLEELIKLRSVDLITKDKYPTDQLAESNRQEKPSMSTVNPTKRVVSARNDIEDISLDKSAPFDTKIEIENAKMDDIADKKALFKAKVKIRNIFSAPEEKQTDEFELKPFEPEKRPEKAKIFEQSSILPASKVAIKPADIGFKYFEATINWETTLDSIMPAYEEELFPIEDAGTVMSEAPMDIPEPEQLLRGQIAELDIFDPVEELQPRTGKAPGVVTVRELKSVEPEQDDTAFKLGVADIVDVITEEPVEFSPSDPEFAEQDQVAADQEPRSANVVCDQELSLPTIDDVQLYAPNLFIVQQPWEQVEDLSVIQEPCTDVATQNMPEIIHNELEVVIPNEGTGDLVIPESSDSCQVVEVRADEKDASELEVTLLSRAPENEDLWTVAEPVVHILHEDRVTVEKAHRLQNSEELHQNDVEANAEIFELDVQVVDDSWLQIELGTLPVPGSSTDVPHKAQEVVPNSTSLHLFGEVALDSTEILSQKPTEEKSEEIASETNKLILQADLTEEILLSSALNIDDQPLETEEFPPNSQRCDEVAEIFVLPTADLTEQIPTSVCEVIEPDEQTMLETEPVDYSKLRDKAVTCFEVVDLNSQIGEKLQPIEASNVPYRNIWERHGILEEPERDPQNLEPILQQTILEEHNITVVEPEAMHKVSDALIWLNAHEVKKPSKDIETAKLRSDGPPDLHSNETSVLKSVGQEDVEYLDLNFIEEIEISQPPKDQCELISTPATKPDAKVNQETLFALPIQDDSCNEFCSPIFPKNKQSQSIKESNVNHLNRIEERIAPTLSAYLDVWDPLEMTSLFVRNEVTDKADFEECHEHFDIAKLNKIPVFCIQADLETHKMTEKTGVLDLNQAVKRLDVERTKSMPFIDFNQVDMPDTDEIDNDDFIPMETQNDILESIPLPLVEEDELFATPSSHVLACNIEKLPKKPKKASIMPSLTDNAAHVEQIDWHCALPLNEQKVPQNECGKSTDETSEKENWRHDQFPYGRAKVFEIPMEKVQPESFGQETKDAPIVEITKVEPEKPEPRQVKCGAIPLMTLQDVLPEKSVWLPEKPEPKICDKEFLMTSLLNPEPNFEETFSLASVQEFEIPFQSVDFMPISRRRPVTAAYGLFDVKFFEGTSEPNYRLAKPDDAFLALTSLAEFSMPKTEKLTANLLDVLDPKETLNRPAKVETPHVFSAEEASLFWDCAEPCSVEKPEKVTAGAHDLHPRNSELHEVEDSDVHVLGRGRPQFPRLLMADDHDDYFLQPKVKKAQIFKEQGLGKQATKFEHKIIDLIDGPIEEDWLEMEPADDELNEEFIQPTFKEMVFKEPPKEDADFKMAIVREHKLPDLQTGMLNAIEPQIEQCAVKSVPERPKERVLENLPISSACFDYDNNRGSDLTLPNIKLTENCSEAFTEETHKIPDAYNTTTALAETKNIDFQFADLVQNLVPEDETANLIENVTPLKEAEVNFTFKKTCMMDEDSVKLLKTFETDPINSAKIHAEQEIFTTFTPNDVKLSTLSVNMHEQIEVVDNKWLEVGPQRDIKPKVDQIDQIAEIAESKLHVLDSDEINNEVCCYQEFDFGEEFETSFEIEDERDQVEVENYEQPELIHDSNEVVVEGLSVNGSKIGELYNQRVEKISVEPDRADCSWVSEPLETQNNLQNVNIGRGVNNSQEFFLTKELKPSDKELASEKEQKQSLNECFEDRRDLLSVGELNDLQSENSIPFASKLKPRETNAEECILEVEESLHVLSQPEVLNEHNIDVIPNLRPQVFELAPERSDWADDENVQLEEATLTSNSVESKPISPEKYEWSTASVFEVTENKLKPNDFIETADESPLETAEATEMQEIASHEDNALPYFTCDSDIFSEPAPERVLLSFEPGLYDPILERELVPELSMADYDYVDTVTCNLINTTREVTCATENEQPDNNRSHKLSEKPIVALADEDLVTPMLETLNINNREVQIKETQTLEITADNIARLTEDFTDTTPVETFGIEYYNCEKLEVVCMYDEAFMIENSAPVESSPPSEIPDFQECHSQFGYLLEPQSCEPIEDPEPDHAIPRDSEYKELNPQCQESLPILEALPTSQDPVKWVTTDKIKKVPDMTEELLPMMVLKDDLMEEPKNFLEEPPRLFTAQESEIKYIDLDEIAPLETEVIDLDTVSGKPDTSDLSEHIYDALPLEQENVEWFKPEKLPPLKDQKPKTEQCVADSMQPSLNKSRVVKKSPILSEAEPKTMNLMAAGEIKVLEKPTENAIITPQKSQLDTANHKFEKILALNDQKFDTIYTEKAETNIKSTPKEEASILTEILPDKKLHEVADEQLTLSENNAEEKEVEQLKLEDLSENEPETADIFAFDDPGLQEAELNCDYTDALGLPTGNDFVPEKVDKIAPEKPLDSCTKDVVTNQVANALSRGPEKVVIRSRPDEAGIEWTRPSEFFEDTFPMFLIPEVESIAVESGIEEPFVDNLRDSVARVDEIPLFTSEDLASKKKVTNRALEKEMEPMNEATEKTDFEQGAVSEEKEDPVFELTELPDIESEIVTDDTVPDLISADLTENDVIARGTDEFDEVYTTERAEKLPTTSNLENGRMIPSSQMDLKKPICKPSEKISAAPETKIVLPENAQPFDVKSEPENIDKLEFLPDLEEADETMPNVLCNGKEFVPKDNRTERTEPLPVTSQMDDCARGVAPDPTLYVPENEYPSYYKFFDNGDDLALHDVGEFYETEPIAPVHVERMPFFEDEIIDVVDEVVREGLGELPDNIPDVLESREGSIEWFKAEPLPNQKEEDRPIKIRVGQDLATPQVTKRLPINTKPIQAEVELLTAKELKPVEPIKLELETAPDKPLMAPETTENKEFKFGKIIQRPVEPIWLEKRFIPITIEVSMPLLNEKLKEAVTDPSKLRGIVPIADDVTKFWPKEHPELLWEQFCLFLRFSGTLPGNPWDLNVVGWYDSNPKGGLEVTFEDLDDWDKDELELPKYPIEKSRVFADPTLRLLETWYIVIYEYFCGSPEESRARLKEKIEKLITDRTKALRSQLAKEAKQPPRPALMSSDSESDSDTDDDSSIHASSGIGTYDDETLDSESERPVAPGDSEEPNETDRPEYDSDDLMRKPKGQLRKPRSPSTSSDESDSEMTPMHPASGLRTVEGDIDLQFLEPILNQCGFMPRDTDFEHIGASPRTDPSRNLIFENKFKLSELPVHHGAKIFESEPFNLDVKLREIADDGEEKKPESMEPKSSSESSDSSEIPATEEPVIDKEQEIPDIESIPSLSTEKISTVALIGSSNSQLPVKKLVLLMENLQKEWLKRPLQPEEIYKSLSKIENQDDEIEKLSKDSSDTEKFLTKIKESVVDELTEDEQLTPLKDPENAKLHNFLNDFRPEIDYIEEIMLVRSYINQKPELLELEKSLKALKQADLDPKVLSLLQSKSKQAKLINFDPADFSTEPEAETPKTGDELIDQLLTDEMGLPVDQLDRERRRYKLFKECLNQNLINLRPLKKMPRDAIDEVVQMITKFLELKDLDFSEPEIDDLINSLFEIGNLEDDNVYPWVEEPSVEMIQRIKEKSTERVPEDTALVKRTLSDVLNDVKYKILEPGDEIDDMDLDLVASNFKNPTKNFMLKLVQYLELVQKLRSESAQVRRKPESSDERKPTSIGSMIVQKLRPENSDKDEKQKPENINKWIDENLTENEKQIICNLRTQLCRKHVLKIVEQNPELTKADETDLPQNLERVVLSFWLSIKDVEFKRLVEIDQAQKPKSNKPTNEATENGEPEKPETTGILTPASYSKLVDDYITEDQKSDDPVFAIKSEPKELIVRSYISRKVDYYIRELWSRAGTVLEPLAWQLLVPDEFESQKENIEVILTLVYSCHAVYDILKKKDFNSIPGVKILENDPEISSKIPKGVKPETVWHLLSLIETVLVSYVVLNSFEDDLTDYVTHELIAQLTIKPQRDAKDPSYQIPKPNRYTQPRDKLLPMIDSKPQVEICVRFVVQKIAEMQTNSKNVVDIVEKLLASMLPEEPAAIPSQKISLPKLRGISFEDKEPEQKPNEFSRPAARKLIENVIGKFLEDQLLKELPTGENKIPGKDELSTKSKLRWNLEPSLSVQDVNELDPFLNPTDIEEFAKILAPSEPSDNRPEEKFTITTIKKLFRKSFPTRFVSDVITFNKTSESPNLVNKIESMNQDDRDERTPENQDLDDDIYEQNAEPAPGIRIEGSEFYNPDRWTNIPRKGDARDPNEPKLLVRPPNWFNRYPAKPEREPKLPTTETNPGVTSLFGQKPKPSKKSPRAVQGPRAVERPEEPSLITEQEPELLSPVELIDQDPKRGTVSSIFGVTGRVPDLLYHMAMTGVKTYEVDGLIMNKIDEEPTKDMPSYEVFFDTVIKATEPPEKHSPDEESPEQTAPNRPGQTPQQIDAMPDDNVAPDDLISRGPLLFLFRDPNQYPIFLQDSPTAQIPDVARTQFEPPESDDVDDDNDDEDPRSKQPKTTPLEFTELLHNPEIKNFISNLSPEPEETTVKLRGFLSTLLFEKPNSLPQVHGNFVCLSKSRDPLADDTDHDFGEPIEDFESKHKTHQDNYTWSQFDIDFFSPGVEEAKKPKTDDKKVPENKVPKSQRKPKRQEEPKPIVPVTKDTMRLQFENVLRNCRNQYFVQFFDVPELQPQKYRPEQKTGVFDKIVQPLLDSKSLEEPESPRLKQKFDNSISFRLLTKPLKPKQDVVVPKDIYEKLMKLPADDSLHDPEEKTTERPLNDPQNLSPFLKDLDLAFEGEEPVRVLEKNPLNYTYNCLTETTDFYILHHPRTSTYKGSLIADYWFGKSKEPEAKWFRPQDLAVQPRRQRAAKTRRQRKSRRHVATVTQLSIATAAISREPEPLEEFETSPEDYAFVIQTDSQVESSAPGIELDQTYDGFGVEKELVGPQKAEPLPRSLPEKENCTVVKIVPDLKTATVQIAKLLSRERIPEDEFTERTVPIEGVKVREQAHADNTRPEVSKNQVKTTEIYIGLSQLAEVSPDQKCEEILPVVENYTFYETIPAEGLCSSPSNLFEDEPRVAHPFEATFKLEETVPLNLIVCEDEFAMIIEDSRTVENAPESLPEQLYKDCFIEPTEFDFTWTKPEVFKPEKQPIRADVLCQKPVGLQTHSADVLVKARNTDNVEGLLKAIPFNPKPKSQAYCEEIVHEPQKLNETSSKEVVLQSAIEIVEEFVPSFKDEPFVVDQSYASQCNLGELGYGPKDFHLRLLNVFQASARPEEFSRCKAVPMVMEQFVSQTEQSYAMEEETDATLQTNPGIFKPQIYGIDDDDWWEGMLIINLT